MYCQAICFCYHVKMSSRRQTHVHVFEPCVHVSHLLCDVFTYVVLYRNFTSVVSYGVNALQLTVYVHHQVRHVYRCVY